MLPFVATITQECLLTWSDFFVAEKCRDTVLNVVSLRPCWLICYLETQLLSMKADWRVMIHL